MGITTLKRIGLFWLIAGLAVSGWAQDPTGSLKGKITDSEGFPLPGAFVYVDSPSMLNIRTYITSETGELKFHGLPPGTYRITVEMPGFKTVNVENIIIRAGKTVRLSIQMEITSIEEETTLSVPTPTGDMTASKISVVIEEELVRKLPLERDFTRVLLLVPGLLPESGSFLGTSILHGSSSRSNLVAFDGMNLNDPVGMYPLTTVNTDLIQEVEVVSGGMPVDAGQIDGGSINIVVRSGSNDLQAEALAYHTGKSLTDDLLSDEARTDPDVIPPPSDTKLWDFSLSLGGPFLRDNLWFFGNARLISQTRSTPFVPWLDPMGKTHPAFDWDNTERMGFFKFTSRFVPSLKITGMFQYTDRNRPFHASSLEWNLPAEATRRMDHETLYQFNGLLSYIHNQDTYVDVKAGYLTIKTPLLVQDAAVGRPHYFDEATGHIWGSALLNDDHLKRRFQAGVYLTRFQDNVLGANHEVRVGAEYAFTGNERSVWKKDNISITYRNGSPYALGMAVSPSSGQQVGKGKVSFLIAPAERDQFIAKFELRRLSFILQDTATIANRLALNFGIRFDRSIASQLSLFKDASGNPLSLSLGETFIRPLGDINPFGQIQAANWKNLMAWNALSPRFGVSFDIFGNGKSLFKASFARYTENMTLDYVMAASPFAPSRSHSFFWYDENGDMIPGGEDTFTPYPEDYRLYAAGIFEKQVAQDVTAPHTMEFTVGFHQEIIDDLSVALTFITKTKKNIFEDVLYEPDSDQGWYTLEQDTQGWWVPFSTIIPQTDEYSATPVTVYFLSPEAPLMFMQFRNVPELQRRYRGFEIAFKKRMSHNWQLTGSLTLSKATGNIGLGHAAASGHTRAADSPNYFVNLSDDSRLEFDRPLIFKLAGTYRFPYNIFLSLFYLHTSGVPWARTVTIFPPEDFLAGGEVSAIPATVFLESPGTRRTEAIDSLDIRVEKEFWMSPNTRVSFLLDVFNVLGNSYEWEVLDDGGSWYPAGENSSEGIRILSPNYKKITSRTGVRSFRIGLRLRF